VSAFILFSAAALAAGQPAPPLLDKLAGPAPNPPAAQVSAADNASYEASDMKRLKMELPEVADGAQVGVHALGLKLKVPL
jgi:hypothetical protein